MNGGAVVPRGVRGVTARQLHYWCDAGLLGHQHRNVGSGGRHDWTPAEIAALTALGRVAESLRSLGLPMSQRVVWLLWSQLVQHGRASAGSGCVSVRVEVASASSATTIERVERDRNSRDDRASAQFF